MKLGSKVTITMGRHKGEGVITSKRGTTATKDDLVVDKDGVKVVIDKKWVEKYKP